MSWYQKIMDYIMPSVDEEEFEDEVEEKIEDKAKVEKKAEPVAEKKFEVKSEPVAEKKIEEEVIEKKVANGSVVQFPSQEATFPNLSSTVGTFRANPVKPTPQFHAAKTPELSVKVYNPTYYNETAKMAADDLLSKCAVVVNYEQSSSSAQQRISDFLGGVCYIKNGSTKKISDKIVLYAPSDVDMEEALSAVMN